MLVVAPVIRPPPPVTAKFTAAPATVLPNASTTRTAGRTGSAAPAPALWSSPACTRTEAAGPAAARAVNVTGAAPSADAVTVATPAWRPSVSRSRAIPSS